MNCQKPGNIKIFYVLSSHLYPSWLRPKNIRKNVVPVVAYVYRFLTYRRLREFTAQQCYGI